MKTNMKTKQIATAVILVAVAVALSPIFIPVGIAKCYPAQALVNVLAGVMLGPFYAVALAAAVGIIRNLLGLGTLLAFPGGMIGAFLAGVAYKASKNIYLAGVGEVIGTGLLGALASIWIVAPVFMSKSMPVFILTISFALSTVAGTVVGIIALHLLRKAGIWNP